jgi:predicted DNA-binding protein (MmcQ/YjbR family)
MDAERLRAFLLTLPHAVETRQWGNNLVFWVGDKAIGGKMFALINLDDPGPSDHIIRLLSFAAGPERYSELLELDGLYPAPYAARNHWVAAEHWQAFRDPEWHEQLRNAHAVIYAKLPPRTKAALDLPAAAQKRLIAERRKLLAAKQPPSKSSKGMPPLKPKPRKKT